VGGSKQGYFGTSRAINPISLKSAAEAASVDASTQAEVNEELKLALAESGEADPERRRERIDSILVSIRDLSEGSVHGLLGGSLAKRTYVEGLSDVDALVVISDTDAVESPALALQFLESALRRRLPLTDVDSISRGRLAITVTYRDGLEVQLLPAVRVGDRVSISSAAGDAWSPIEPQAFTEKLSEVNQHNGGRVIHVVRLVKQLLASLPESRRPSGYHIESLAIEAFEGYTGPATYRDMVLHYLGDAAQRVLQPIVDSTGQSVHVDDDFGPPESIPRRLVSDSLGRMQRRLSGSADRTVWHEALSAANRPVGEE